MLPRDRRMLDAWLIASVDLDFQITTAITLPRPGEAPATFLCLIHGFGSARGTLICTTDDELQQPFEIAKRAGFHASGLNPAVYETYERQHFIDTLEDWGWFGAGPAPVWYKGQSPWG